MTVLAVSMGVANPIPTLTPVGTKNGRIDPDHFPEESMSGPPELPGLMDASSG